MVAEASRKKPTAVFIAFGTKGDVYPISAIAAAFASDQKQYEVSFVTHSAHEAFLYEKVKAMRPDLREGGDTLLPILKFSSKRWIYNSVWPELQKLTISNIKIWECENCNTCEVKSLTSQEVKSLETRGPRFPKTRDVDVVNEYSAQVMNVGGDAYVQVLMLGAIEQATSENEELGRYMSYYGPQKIADCLKADLKADSWQLLETLNDNLLGYSSASAQQFVSIDDESVAFDLDRKTDIDEAPVVSAAPAAPVVPAAAVAPAVPAAAVALALNTLQLEFSKNLKGHLGAKGVEYFPISSPPVLSSVQEYHFGGSTDGSFSMRKKEITKKHRQECLSVVERIYGGAPIMDGDLIIINFFALEGWSLAELFNVRCVVAAPYVVPYSAPSSFERQFRNELPLLYNYLREAPTGKAGWDDVIHWMWPLFTEAWGTWRSHDLQLSFWPFTDPVTGLPTWHVRPSSTLLLYGFSQEVVECPGYWPSAVRVCGFWFPPAEWQFSCTTCAEISSLTSLRKLNAENELCSIHATLKRFLDSSAERPIFLCLSSVGSMGYLRNPQAFLQVLGDVLNITNRSIILLSAGYGPLDAAIKMFAQTQSSATEQMQFSEIQSCLFEGRLFCYSGAIPYSWIFPRCAAAIHHGGSGSTAAALRTGIPQVICPFILDQFYWAERMFWLGVASEPLNSACLLPDKDDDTCISKAAKVLVGAINYALSPEVKLRAAQIADRISNEDGVSTALQIIKKEILCIDAPN